MTKRAFWSRLVLGVLFIIPVILWIQIAGYSDGALCLSSIVILGVALTLLLIVLTRGEL